MIGAYLRALRSLAECRFRKVEVLLGIAVSVDNTTRDVPEPFAPCCAWAKAFVTKRCVRAGFRSGGATACFPTAAPPRSLRPVLRTYPDIGLQGRTADLPDSRHIERTGCWRCHQQRSAGGLRRLHRQRVAAPRSAPRDAATCLCHRPLAPVARHSHVLEVTHEDLVADVQRILDAPSAPEIRHGLNIFVSIAAACASDLIFPPRAADAPRRRQDRGRGIAGLTALIFPSTDERCSGPIGSHETGRPPPRSGCSGMPADTRRWPDRQTVGG